MLYTTHSTQGQYTALYSSKVPARVEPAEAHARVGGAERLDAAVRRRPLVQRRLQREAAPPVEPRVPRHPLVPRRRPLREQRHAARRGGLRLGPLALLQQQSP